ncbi:MAG: DUF2267 domain-containing protein [Ktedonobacterales bacterium]|nr:DUF2267 domain-containing protein [Ktedonobacterales bacterium]
MEQLVQMVSEKTGLAPDVAQQAVQVVLGFLKDKLPGPIASQIDAVAGGNAPDAGGLGDQVKKGLGGLFGQ